MKRPPFQPGDLVVNSGRLRGMGYIWRVEGYETYDFNGRGKMFTAVVCRNIGPLHGAPDRNDHAVGGRFLRDPKRLELLGQVKPAYQMPLL